MSSYNALVLVVQTPTDNGVVSPTSEPVNLDLTISYNGNSNLPPLLLKTATADSVEKDAYNQTLEAGCATQWWWNVTSDQLDPSQIASIELAVDGAATRPATTCIPRTVWVTVRSSNTNHELIGGIASVTTPIESGGDGMSIPVTVLG